MSRFQCCCCIRALAGIAWLTLASDVLLTIAHPPAEPPFPPTSDQDVYVVLKQLAFKHSADRSTAGTAEHITTDVLSTRVPEQAVNDNGRNSFAIGDGASKRGTSVDEKQLNVEIRRASTENDDLHPAPTEEEFRTLRRVSDKVPMVIWLLCLVEFSERASYYGAKTVFSNFMQYPLPKGGKVQCVLI